MITIGIDIGTTSIGAVAMDTEARRVLRSHTIDNGTFLPGESWERIQNPGKIMEKTIALLDEFIAAYPKASGIGLTGQMHGITYLDKDGHSISPLYIWQDGRGDLPLESLGGRSVVQYVQETYDIPAATGYGLITHCYNMAAGLVPADACSASTIMDYLGMVLTGRKRPLMHASDAASFGFFDSAKFTFLTDILAKEGIPALFLPEVTSQVEQLGDYHGIPVYTALGDNQASFLGAVGMAENTWQINVGTGGQISVLSHVPFTAPGIEARPYINRSWILTGSVLCAGRAYAILENFFRSYAAACGAPEGTQYGIMAKLAEETVESDRFKSPADRTTAAAVTSSAGAKTSTEVPLKVCTKFAGTRLDPSARGFISNISETNFTPGQMIRGLLFGMTDEFMEIGAPIIEGTGMKVEQLIGSGNGLRKNPLLQQMFSETFRAPLTMSTFVEEAASGAALSVLYAVQ